MLKLNYTDHGLFLELVDASLEVVATQRVMLAVYAGEALHLEPGRAAFLLSATVPGVTKLWRILQADTTGSAAIAPVDAEFVEISLKGTWIASSTSADAGTFITALNPESEALIYQVWTATQTAIAYVA